LATDRIAEKEPAHGTGARSTLILLQEQQQRQRPVYTTAAVRRCVARAAAAAAVPAGQADDFGSASGDGARTSPTTAAAGRRVRPADKYGQVGGSTTGMGR